MPLEEAIQFGASLEPKQLAGPKCRERAGPISFDGKCFQRRTRGIGLPGQVVGELDGYLHGLSVAKRGRECHSLLKTDGEERSEWSMVELIKE
jgi:hypothetical protein